MRIRSLHIDGFGKFADFDCGPFEGPVTVFLGANEAGKSTLLAFIRRVLFGFPDGRSRRNPYPPIAGGQHGGSVTFVSDAGEVITVRRFSGTGGGTPALTSAAGAPIAATELPKLLGNHSMSVFEHVFAFSLDELHDDALLRDESINGQIYSVGMGASRLPGALRILDQEKRDLFLKGGSKHAIHEIAEAIDRVDSRLRDVRNNAERYGRLSTRLAQIESELGELGERRSGYESKLRRYRNLERAWEDWNDLLEAEHGLRNLPEIDEFPENGVGRLETLDEQAAAAREELEKASRRVLSARRRAELPIEREAILRESAAIGRLQRARNSFDQSVRDLPQRQVELAAIQSRLAKTLAELGPDWTAERLSEFDLSIAVREEVSAHADRLRTETENRDHLRSAALQVQKAMDEASDAVERARDELQATPRPALDADGIDARRLLIRRARNTLDEHGRAAVRANDLRSQLGDEAEDASPTRPARRDRVLAVILAAAGLTVLFLGVALPGDWATGIAVAIPLLAAAAFVLFRARRSARPSARDAIRTRIRQQADESERQSKSLRERLAAQAGELGVASVDVDALDAQEDALVLERERLAARQGSEKALVQAETQLQRRRVDCDASAKAIKDAETTLQAAEDKWRQWLADRKLQQTFSPQNIEVLEGRVDFGRTQSDEVLTMQGRISAIREDIDRFVAEVVRMAALLDIEIDPNDHLNVARIADALIESHTEVEKQAQAREDARDELRQAEEEQAHRDGSRKEVANQIGALLQSGGAENTEEFRRRAVSFAERTRLQARLDASNRNLQRISGPGARLAAFTKRLAASDPAIIGQGIDRCQAELETIESKRSELDTERGSVTTEREQLLGEEASSRLRAEGHRLREQMDGHARKWAIRMVAENLLREARGRFEKERQPDVLRHSEGYFRDMTGGRYRTVFSPLSSSEIHVTDDDGGSKQPAQLSRGTREQLFLSLRFGLIRELGERSERLPVIVDEALVNFDADRGARAARAFTELADQNQMLVFTCHRQVADWFADAANESGARQPQVIGL